MVLLRIFILVVLLPLLIIPFLSPKWKGLITMIFIALICIVSSIPAVIALTGEPFELLLKGTYITREIPIRIDALSAWFMLTINFTFITGMIYGREYMKSYQDQGSNLSLHWIAYILANASLIGICSVQNSISFLIIWEIMALSVFILVIFEHHKQRVLKAGMNYLIQSHIGILFLTVSFIWITYKMNSFDFNAITNFTSSNNSLTAIILFFCFFIGFGIKAGFVPFHTWLPLAHPAAPTHVSGVMSGVIIKIGIYGILRMILLIKADYSIVGYILLFVSVLTGIYGVMLAMIQHNLKKLLAYHSIENIGIIGMGIGLGCIGLGAGNKIIAVMGFLSALLHTLNHSLFKSLLFYGAGNIYQSTHTVNIEKLGGLGKSMSRTSILFLIASLAICGLPPFNGFVSEFILYSGLFNGLGEVKLSFLLFTIFSIFGLALIGGLALMCFTKAFGTIFLGQPRKKFSRPPEEAGYMKLVPMYMVSFFILLIGLFPKLAVRILSAPVNELTGLSGLPLDPETMNRIQYISMIGYVSMGFIVLTGVLLLIRRWITRSRIQTIQTTWGCGYTFPSEKMQYTASSFIRPFRKLAEPLLTITKHKKELTGVFPGTGEHVTHPQDKIEDVFVKSPVILLKRFLNLFSFLQHGNPQIYVLYGLVFIILISAIPALYDFIQAIIMFLRNI